METCPFCHEPVTARTRVCKGRLPGTLGLVALSPGPCGSTPETRAAKNEEKTSAARSQQQARDSRYARDLR